MLSLMRITHSRSLDNGGPTAHVRKRPLPIRMKKAAPATPPTPTVLLFLKAPRPGTVKTRLAASIGTEAALSIYRSLAERQVERLPPNWALTIYFTPPEALPEMQRWVGDTEADLQRAQKDGHFGEVFSE